MTEKCQVIQILLINSGIYIPVPKEYLWESGFQGRTQFVGSKRARHGHGRHIVGLSQCRFYFRYGERNQDHVLKRVEEDLKENSFIFLLFSTSFLNDIYIFIVIMKIFIVKSLLKAQKIIKNRMHISLKSITQMKPLLTFSLHIILNISLYLHIITSN